VLAKPRVDGSDQFDPLFFSVSPSEAATLDPQHRLMLEEAWKALEDAGYPPDSNRRSVGVYISQFASTYEASLVGPWATEMGPADLFQGDDRQ